MNIQKEKPHFEILFHLAHWCRRAKKDRLGAILQKSVTPSGASA